MSEPEATPPPPRRGLQQVRRPISSAVSQVDRAAGHVERISSGLVEKASARVEQRRGGAAVVAILRQLRAGIVFMVRDWRLVLLQVPAAITISLLLYRIRVRARGVEEITTLSAGALILWLVVALLVGAVVLPCGTVFAFAATETSGGDRADLGRAFAETRRRWRLLLAWTIVLALLLVGLFLLARQFGRAGYTAVGLCAVGVLVLFIAIVPIRVSSVRPRKDRPRLPTRKKARLAAAGVSAKVLMEAPTMGMGELGRVFSQVPGLRIFGYTAVVVGGLLHMAASSSVRAQKITTKLGRPAPHPADEVTPPTP